VPKTTNTPAKLKVEYDTVRPRAERLLVELERQLHAIVAEAKTTLAFGIEKRVKSWESILQKRRRHALRLASVTELHDLCGLRIVTLFRRDAEKVAELIVSRFNILSEEDTAANLRDDRFGYSSIHLVVDIPDSWQTVPTLADLRGLRAEIQVRSVAQHLWAAASHALQYKTESSVPPPVRRALSRVSALLEVVDLELARVVDERAGYRELLPTQVTTVLNSDSLESTLDSLLPAENKDHDEIYDSLLEELLHFEIDTPMKVRSLWKKRREAVLKAERTTVANARANGEAEIPDEERIFTKGVYFAHSGLIRIALSKEFGAAWARYMDAKSQFLAKHYPLDDEELDA